MFRHLPSGLPKDPQFPADLEQLGYFINEKDQLRMIQKPEQKYLYRINRSERVNDLYKEATNTCVRKLVEDRLLKLGLTTLRLPIGAQANDRNIPVYISNEAWRKKRFIVIFGERNQELGILSYRIMGEDGIAVGSVIELVNAVADGSTTSSSVDVPGILIANPGQLIWYRGESRAISYREYLNLPRPSAVHGPFRIDPVKNRVPHNSNYTEHVEYIFEKVLSGLVPDNAKLDLIGLEYTGDAMINYLAEHWSAWSSRINGICLGNPQLKLRDLSPASAQNSHFTDFLSKRARAYFVSDKKIETPLPGRDEHGYNCYASGEELYEEGILIKSWKSMLDWFNMISVLEDYEEPVFKIVEVD